VEELHPAALSPAKSVLVYSRRKKLGKPKLVVDVGQVLLICRSWEGLLYLSKHCIEFTFKVKV